MSSSKSSPDNGPGKKPKRALPSWMSARDDRKDYRPANDDNDQVEGAETNARGHGKGVKDCADDSESRETTSSAGPSSLAFSKLLDGVVVVLSGFVNPERGILRSHVLEMGAEYQQDWNSNCTLLVCAFRNTPKFRQVQSDNGTIVSKDWITECHTQKKLVDIETYLMHVGKPWRKSNVNTADRGTSRPSKSHKNEVKRPEVKPNASTSSKELRGDASSSLKEKFSPAKVKKWAIDDLNTTLTWLESQEEKPEPSEIRSVAAEGILTCLQDAIDLLDNNQDLQQLTEQWNIVPHVVQEIIKVQGTGNSSSSTSKEDFRKQALFCKKIYEEELQGNSDGSNKEPKSKSRDKGKGKLDTTRDLARNPMDYDSDETVEMTEDEINYAYDSIASNMPQL